MDKLLARIKVVVSAAPTLLTLLAVAAAAALQQVGDLPESTATRWAVKVLGALVAGIPFAVMIIRRVTPVLERQRGILPQADAPKTVQIDMTGPVDR